MGCFPCFGSPSQGKEKVKKKIEGIVGADCKQEFSAAPSSHHSPKREHQLRKKAMLAILRHRHSLSVSLLQPLRTLDKIAFWVKVALVAFIKEVIYRDFKSSNILLGKGYHPKLSDFGLAKLGPVGDKTHVSTRVMGTYGYCAPEYAMTGQLTVKSDVYSFGVVLLELITGRKAIDNTRPVGEQYLVAWVRCSLTF
ncbi:hypothetical protein BHE74_00038805 [Ensete ventricosum]|nr:hypothetical protein BHE74_00038805 [Ensete ventricosum]RZS13920.1 hypothetical protein BHM03_00045556 [Ensete ventricosum]